LTRFFGPDYHRRERAEQGNQALSFGVAKMESDEQSMPDEALQFLQLIAMFQMAALQQMGKLVNPATNEVERDLQHAKASIDMLELIKNKTKGNLTDTEVEFLDKILFELHINYVDEVDRAAEEDEEKKKGEDAEEKDRDESAVDPGDESDSGEEENQ
jgi:hypothetical protein